jgi:8-hydroxy-5-deazaflavin:NADPH oxidoreductase
MRYQPKLKASWGRKRRTADPLAIRQQTRRHMEIHMKLRGITGFSRRDMLKVTGVAAALSVLPITARMVNAADSQKMKIGIIGSGHVGSALGGVWAKAGNEVMFSSRNLDSDKKLAAEVGATARAGTPQEAAAFGQVILFAVPYSAFPELMKSLGNSLKGKVVINASNPFPQRDGEIANQAREQGAGLFDAHLLQGALVVRAFNAVPAARMASAHEDPVVVGGLDMAKYLMPGTPLAGEHTPDEVRSIAATLKP